MIRHKKLKKKIFAMSQITRKNFSEPKKGCKSVKYCLYNGKLK